MTWDQSKYHDDATDIPYSANFCGFLLVSNTRPLMTWVQLAAIKTSHFST